MPFLAPNQQCQSTEGKKYHIPWTCSSQAQKESLNDVFDHERLLVTWWRVAKPLVSPQTSLPLIQPIWIVSYSYYKTSVTDWVTTDMSAVQLVRTYSTTVSFNQPSIPELLCLLKGLPKWELSRTDRKQFSTGWKAWMPFLSLTTKHIKASKMPVY